MEITDIAGLIRSLKNVFMVVRLVDLVSSTEIEIDEDGNLVETPYHCFSTWHKCNRCENCISAKAVERKGMCSKFEFADNEVYYAIAKYVELNGNPYTLEMVSNLEGDVAIEAFGKQHFMSTVADYNRQLYTDPLTDAYNRRYYDDHLQHIEGRSGVAVIDVDNFKTINDSYGHLAGDAALKGIVGVVRQCIRENDALIRYGGDEFVLILYGIPGELFEEKLQQIRQQVNGLELKETPGHVYSVSIGAVHGERAPSAVLQHADDELYTAKAVKNTVSVRML